MKQAYRRIPGDWGNWIYQKIDLLPECKRETRLGRTYEYQKARIKLLGFITYTTWIEKCYIARFPEETVEYYKCSCGEENE